MFRPLAADAVRACFDQCLLYDVRDGHVLCLLLRNDMRRGFFESQDAARRRTGLLAFLFVLGVTATMAAAWAVVVFAIKFIQGKDEFANPKLALQVSAAIVGLVGVVSLFKLLLFSIHGNRIAKLLGGVALPARPTDPREQELIDVVTEMSIASGMPVPAVFVLDDQALNAFAAGPSKHRAVIGVTRGLLAALSRDELQGVVAHEFSHIAYGDTRINARATAAVAGMTAIQRIGKWTFLILLGVYLGILELLTIKKKRKRRNYLWSGLFIVGTFGLVLVGLAIVGAIWIVGLVGVFFARLIQAAISRQREFLADAAAVQYTRNPSGLLGALVKVRNQCSLLDNDRMEDLDHFFFCDSVETLFATHPPIEERIRRLREMDPTRPPGSP